MDIDYTNKMSYEGFIDGFEPDDLRSGQTDGRENDRKTGVRPIKPVQESNEFAYRHVGNTGIQEVDLLIQELEKLSNLKRIWEIHTEKNRIDFNSPDTWLSSEELLAMTLLNPLDLDTFGFYTIENLGQEFYGTLRNFVDSARSRICSYLLKEKQREESGHYPNQMHIDY